MRPGGRGAAAATPFPTTALSDRAWREAVTIEHALRAEYGWDAGVAVGAYLEGLREGRILGRECRRCRRVLVPPRLACERCFRPTDAWVAVPDRGAVVTFSVCRVTWDLRPLDPPEIPAVIALDGAADGPGILHRLGNVDASHVRIGMPVRAVWRPPAERGGSVLDIAFWQPDPGEADRAADAPEAPGVEATPPPSGHRSYPGAVPVSHRYTAGIAGDRFFRALRDSEVLLATRCEACALTWCPPRLFCRRCFGHLREFVEVGPESTLVSFTRLHLGLGGERLAEPVTIGLLRPEGADTCLVHRVVAPGGPAVGMRMRPALRPPAERVGGMGDIAHFEPAEGHAPLPPG